MSKPAPSSRALVWHICKKDLRLIWPLALGIALGQLALVLLQSHARPFDMGDGASFTGAIFSVGLGIGICLLIFMIVQSDGVAGADQDWLVRPIGRRDLLLAKISTVLTLVHAPIFIGNLITGLAEGFALGETLRATLLGSAEIALWFTFPVMAIGALTKSITEALLTGLAILFGALMIAWLASSISQQPTVHTGLAWVWGDARHGLLFGVSLAVLVWQYQRRNTVAARRLFIVGVLAFAWMPSLPWQPAYEIQRALANPDVVPTAKSLAVAAPTGDSAAAVGAPESPIFLDAAERKAATSEAPKKLVRLSLPLQFSDLPAGVIVHIDRAAVRLMDASGRRVYSGAGKTFAVSAKSDAGRARASQLFYLPRRLQERLSDQPLQLRIRYSLTILRPRALPALAARTGEQFVPELGRCASRVDDGGKGLNVACATVGEQPMCLSLSVRSSGNAAQGSEHFVCDLNFEPAALRFSADVFDHFDENLPFAAGAGPAEGAEISIRVYEAVEHLERTLVIPGFRLRN
jgi:hypothetical protein